MCQHIICGTLITSLITKASKGVVIGWETIKWQIVVAWALVLTQDMLAQL